jgi:hypothetical protein
VYRNKNTAFSTYLGYSWEKHRHRILR